MATGLVVVGLGVVVVATMPPATLAAGGATATFAVVVILTAATLIAAVVGAVYLVICLANIRTACPKCRKWGAKEIVETKVLEVKKCFGLVTRHAHTSSTGYVSLTANPLYGGTVRNSGVTSWQERVPVIRTTYLTLYRCRFCLVRWEKVRVKEVEDFERG
jgi:hypothetical protein